MFKLGEEVSVRVNGREDNPLMARILGFSADHLTAFVEARFDVPVDRLSFIETTPPQPIVCSFCAKTQGEVKAMIAGHGAYICDECVPVTVKIVTQQAAKAAKQKRAAKKKRKPSTRR